MGREWDFLPGFSQVEGEVGLLILFPDTDFLFGRYQPSAHLLCGAEARKMSRLPSPHSLHPLPPSQGGRGSGRRGSKSAQPIFGFLRGGKGKIRGFEGACFGGIGSAGCYGGLGKALLGASGAG